MTLSVFYRQYSAEITLSRGEINLTYCSRLRPGTRQRESFARQSIYRLLLVWQVGVEEVGKYATLRLCLAVRGPADVVGQSLGELLEQIGHVRGH